MIYFFFSSRRRHTRYWRDWSSDVCSSDLFGEVTDGSALGDLEGDALHRLAEELAILRLADGLDGGPEQLDAVLVEGTELVQLDGEVQGRLATEGREEGVRAFAADDLGDRRGG